MFPKLHGGCSPFYPVAITYPNKEKCVEKMRCSRVYFKRISRCLDMGWNIFSNIWSIASKTNALFSEKIKFPDQSESLVQCLIEQCQQSWQLVFDTNLPSIRSLICLTTYPSKPSSRYWIWLISLKNSDAADILASGLEFSHMNTPSRLPGWKMLKRACVEGIT